MDYKRTPAWWAEHKYESGEELSRTYGGDGAHWRRAKRTYVDSDAPAPTVRRGIAVFDLHHPKHDKKLWANILRFTEDFDPDIFVFGGDNQDLEVVSHWVGNKRKVVEGKRLKKDFDTFNDDILDPLDCILRDDVERVFHLGNHEDWLYQYLEVHPEMEGLIEFELNLHLDKWRMLQYGEVSKFGHLHATHGTYCNLHHAMKTAQVYGRSMMYGHLHTLQTHTLVTPLDSLPYAATAIPCACHMNPDYAKNRPNSWTNGFAVYYIQPNGLFNLYPVVAIDGCFVSPDGTIYE